MLSRLVMLAAAVVFATSAMAEPINKQCPISGGDINASKTSEYNGKTVAFCCSKCKTKFDKDPQQFVSKIDGLADAPAEEAAEPATVTVKGKVIVPENDKGIGESFENSRFALAERIVIPPPPLPEGFDKMSPQERQAWSVEFFQSDEGKKWQAKRQEIINNRKVYEFKVEEDGTFKVKDVKPANYIFQGQLLSEDGRGPVAEIAPRIVEVKEDTDLGELMFNLPLAIGDAAPEIEFVTVTGDKKKLSDFRGQYVVIDFWATWCGPCKAETPNLKAIYAKYGSRDDFEIIGLSSDQDKKLPLEYYKKNDVQWVNGHIGVGSDAASAYNVRGIPSIWLIGPEGKILASGGEMRMQNTMGTIEKHLPKVQAN